MKNWLTLEPDKYAIVGAHRYTAGRARPIDRIVIHHNAGIRMTTEACKQLWDTSREASAHYQVEADGTIGQLVHDKDTAWHAANTDINARSIGIEHANISGPTRWQISDQTVEEGAHLVAALCVGYNLGRPTWGKNVFGHRDFASTSCPYQLAPGGEDHATYIGRAQYWYDQMTTKPQEEGPLMALSHEEQVELLTGVREIRNALLAPRPSQVAGSTYSAPLVDFLMQVDRKVEELHVEYKGGASKAQQEMDALAKAIAEHDAKDEVHTHE